jgi:hypothetical protein
MPHCPALTQPWSPNPWRPGRNYVDIRPDIDHDGRLGWGSVLARLIVVSNRVSIPGDETKRAGGLEVALRPALQQNGGVWLGWSGKIAPTGLLIGEGSLALNEKVV